MCFSSELPIPRNMLRILSKPVTSLGAIEMCLSSLKTIFVSCFFSMEMTRRFCRDLQQWLIHYITVVHCGKYIQYTRRLGSSGDWLLLH
jgi:hypothetical protein